MVTTFVHPGIERSNDIKAATNYRSEKEMLAYIIIVCNGDWETMTESVTGIMTWYEEWYFFFEFIWGRTFSTWSAATRTKAYGMNKEFLLRFFDSKLRIVLCAKESWPTYCSYEKDKSNE